MNVSRNDRNPATLSTGALIREVERLRDEMLGLESIGLGRCGPIHPSCDASARNLLHYLALRGHDLRPLQRPLAELGLSSLGRCEPHALSTVNAVLVALRRLGGENEPQRTSPAPRVDFADGAQLLERHTEALLGPARGHRNVRILVTMPDEAADDIELVRGMLERGMDLARINCAHGDPESWERTIRNLRQAEAGSGKRCRILMDVAGPKLRTGPLQPGPAVVKVRPHRDELGRVVQPSRVWVTGSARPAPAPGDADAVVPVQDAWLGSLHDDDRIAFTDARGAQRELAVLRVLPGGAWVGCDDTSYLVPGTELRVAGHGHGAAGRVGDLPRREGVIVLRPGEELRLSRSLDPGSAALHDARGRQLAPATIGCTLPEVFENVHAGESVWLDDGRIGCRVQAADRDGLLLRVVTARAEGEKLRADKGINLPDSDLRLPALTAKDLVDMPFIVQHADAVALSFVHRPQDVVELEEHLAALGRPDLGIVLKIETRRAFDNLPQLLLASMRGPCAGVMIARGDLAVECGFQRLAEVQEEILWICEAAHVPVIWATQVLETLARDGRPSRAEITDAAMSERAECVMLNKGPHIEAALTTLDDILTRMSAHQQKKRAMLRPLKLAMGLRAALECTEIAAP